MAKKTTSLPRTRAPWCVGPRSMSAKALRTVRMRNQSAAIVSLHDFWKGWIAS